LQLVKNGMRACGAMAVVLCCIVASWEYLHAYLVYIFAIICINGAVACRLFLVFAKPTLFQWAPEVSNPPAVPLARPCLEDGAIDATFHTTAVTKTSVVSGTVVSWDVRPQTTAYVASSIHSEGNTSSDDTLTVQ
jgi:hypothetical protein